MDNLPESETTKEAFKVLERYCQKRYQQAQNVLLSVNSSDFPGLSSAKSILNRSRFSFHSELKRQHSVVSEDGSPDEVAQTVDASFGNEVQPEKQYLIHRESWRSYLLRVGKFLYDRGFKHVLILLLVISYTLLGALMFYWLEADVDHSSRAIIREKIEERQASTMEALTSLLLNEDCVLAEENAEEKLTEECTERLTEIVQWLARHVEMDSGGGSAKSQWAWDYWNAVFFSLSITTTIGYGNLSCKTPVGRLATIIYGLFGIPLMLFLLSSIGQVMFRSVEALWWHAKKKLKRKTRRVRKHIMAGIKSNSKFYMSAENTEPTFRQNTDATILEEAVVQEEEEDRDMFETFPVYLAVVIVFVYIFLCSIIMCLWEDWSYFQAFYFFFISISTIGFGDEMPDHPRYAICFFIFFIIGLSLGSMCITIMQMRVENRYMQALQLIDEQQQLALETTLSPQAGVDSANQRLSPDEQVVEHPMLRATNRWRHPSALGINNEELTNNLSNRLNSVSECLSPAEYYASPILNALIKRRHGSRHNLMRQFSRSVNTTANVSLDTESSAQSPIKQGSMDFLDVVGAPRRLRPKHLWHDSSSAFRASVNSVQSPLTIIVESKSDEVPPLAEQDTDSDGTHSSRQ